MSCLSLTFSCELYDEFPPVDKLTFCCLVHTNSIRIDHSDSRFPVANTIVGFKITIHSIADSYLLYLHLYTLSTAVTPGK